MRSLLFISLIALFCIGCSQAVAPGEEEDDSINILTAWTDATSCSSDADCAAVEFGCGGNHTMCTSDPESYKDRISTCEIVEDHPSNQGYACGCSESKCVWEK